ncbi:hypothetical protein [Sphingomonas sp. ID0503]|uniref:hypothetical protein n=1 Tax=Sphingomonas sp. ID0503 TaxID=3399691 RepID=UPI003AFA7FFA
MDHQIFILMIIALSVGGWVVTTAIRAKHGYPIDGFGFGCKSDMVSKEAPDAVRQVGLLAEENGKLKDMILRLEERISVLERITTDKSNRLSAEIDALR